MKIIITGDCPSKKNNRTISFKMGRFKLLPGKVHQQWYPQALKQLTGIKIIQSVEKIELIFFPKTKRKSDLTNRAESIMDLLVDGGVLEDDNWFICGNLHLMFGGVDKNNPRVEITIN